MRKTQHSKTPVLHYSNRLDLDAPMALVVDLPVDSKYVNHAF